MAIPEAQLNDIGTKIDVTIEDAGSAVDISAATTRQIILEDPTGTSTTKSANFITDGTDGQLRYTTVDGDLHTAGRWRIQARAIAGSSYDFRTQVAVFRVRANL